MALSRRDTLLALASLSLPGLSVAAPAPGGVRLRPLQFPADFGAHPDTGIEWWYITGALWLTGETSGATAARTATPPARPEPVEGPATQAPDFGFQLTFFRVRTPVRPDHPSRFAAKQLLMAHLALTDLKAGRLRHDQRLARAGFGLAEAAEGDTDVTLRPWRLQRLGSPASSTYRAQAHSEAARFGLDLQLASTQPLLLQGEAGYSRKGPEPGTASHYYSQPQLSTTGQLTLDGQRRGVRGRAWLDHEWSNQLLGAGGLAAIGWDWLGINMHDGSALTVFRLRRADGSVSYAGGSHRAPGQPVRSFAPQEVQMQPGRTWLSPRTQGRYPVQWRLQTPAGQFELSAMLDDQELDARHQTGTVYWEGLSRLLDTQGRELGLGYLEMTGYVGALRLGNSGS